MRCRMRLRRRGLCEPRHLPTTSRIRTEAEAGYAEDAITMGGRLIEGCCCDGRTVDQGRTQDQGEVQLEGNHATMRDLFQDLACGSGGCNRADGATEMELEQLAGVLLITSQPSGYQSTRSVD